MGEGKRLNLSGYALDENHNVKYQNFVLHRKNTLTPETIDRSAQKLLVFYKQGASPARIQEYLRHFIRWCQSGIKKHLCYIKLVRQYVLSLRGKMSLHAIATTFLVEGNTHYEGLVCLRVEEGCY